ncbi:unannotated protein [freshwater metagenome]|uniref:Unannotated protein n=1 Tax=freshwater metagenome TaxID=449393 RepID=A0A6J7DG17_9ZZZZ|nr:ribosomal-protein-alanine N-acetyltransferase [Actinomycetota bacterium]
MPVQTAQIRAMHWTDIPAVQTLERQLFPVDPWSVETFWSELALVPQTRCYLVATAQDDDAEELLGYGGVFTVGSDADIQTVAVSPQAQGKGIGRLLLHNLLDTARARGCSRVFLEVRSDNHSAVQMYLKDGFEQTGSRKDYYASGVDATVMRKLIGGTS